MSFQNNSTSHPTAECVHSTTSFGQEHDGEGDPDQYVCMKYCCFVHVEMT